jgi:hypothetical protein
MAKTFLVIAICTISFLFRYLSLHQTEYANGWDSYFYLIQLKSWIETGKMHSPETSLIYPYMLSIHWFLGDYILTYKLTAASLSGIFTLLIIALTYLWSENKKPETRLYLPILMGFWTVFSPHLTYFAAQYPKNLLGINLFLGFVYFFPRNYICSLFLLLLNFFGHRLTFSLSLVYAILFGVNTCQILFFSKIKTFLTQKKFVLGLGLVLLLFFCLYSFGVRTLHFADLERLLEGFSGKINFQFAPISFWKDFEENSHLSFWWKFEILVGVIAWLAFVLRFRNFQSFGNVEQSTFFLMGCLLLLPFLPWSLTSISYRFFLVFVLYCPFFLFFLLNNSVFVISSLQKVQTITITFSVVLMLASAWSWQSYSPKKHDPDYGFYATLTRSVQANLTKSITPELFIVHNALAEYFTFTTGFDALPWQPEYEIAPDKLWRIAGNVTVPELEYFAKKDSFFTEIFRLPGRYALLHEQDWQRIKQNARKDMQLDMEEKADFLKRMEAWENPFRVRPGFLKRHTLDK